LKSVLIEAFRKATDAFIEVNASCFVLAGGIGGGYWVSLGIRYTFNECADAVIRFVHVYFDEVRKIVPEDIPIYIELEENAKPEYLLPGRPSQQPLLAPPPALAIAAGAPALVVVAWRITRRKSKL